jgi:hypothetical protein
MALVVGVLPTFIGSGIGNAAGKRGPATNTLT